VLHAQLGPLVPFVHVPCIEQVLAVQLASATQVPLTSCVPALQLQTAAPETTVHSMRITSVHGLGSQRFATQCPLALREKPVAHDSQRAPLYAVAHVHWITPPVSLHVPPTPHVVAVHAMSSTQCPAASCVPAGQRHSGAPAIETQTCRVSGQCMPAHGSVMQLVHASRPASLPSPSTGGAKGSEQPSAASDATKKQGASWRMAVSTS
jgi:hypothetical protein